MDKLRIAWATARAARQMEDRGLRAELARAAYARILRASAFVMLEDERANRDPLPRLLAASGAVS